MGAGNSAFEKEVLERLGPRMADDVDFAQEVYGAITNLGWRKASQHSKKTGQAHPDEIRADLLTCSYTFRMAGGEIAHMRNKYRNIPKHMQYGDDLAPVCKCGAEKSAHQPRCVTTASAAETWLEAQRECEEFACFPVDEQTSDWQHKLRCSVDAKQEDDVPALPALANNEVSSAVVSVLT